MLSFIPPAVLFPISFAFGFAMVGYIFMETICYRKAIRGAKKGDIHCQFVLGMKYLHGKGPYHSKYKGFMWLFKAAVNGHLGAIIQLGDLYICGDIVDRDYMQAAKWLKQGALKNDPTAMRKLAYLYSLDTSPLYNADKAFEYYKRAASLGDHEAQFMLGMMYRDGIGVEYDIVCSYAWFLLASESGQESMYADSNEVLSELSPEECAAAENMAEAFKCGINTTRH